jgi:hypothetical protein
LQLFLDNLFSLHLEFLHPDQGTELSSTCCT